MKVKVTSEEVLKPSTPTPHCVLELSVLDQVQPRFHGPPMLAFTPRLPEGLTFDQFVQKCKDALAKTLVAFYPIAGRLLQRPGGGLAVDCNDAGIAVRTAEADCKLPQRFAAAPGSSQSMSLSGTQNLFFTMRGADITTVPLLLFQLTRFQDNHVCLYSGFHHSVCDGAAGSLFFYYWHELMRDRVPDFKPVHDRSYLAASGKPLVSEFHPALGIAPLFQPSKIVRLFMARPYLLKCLPYLPQRLIMPDISFIRLAFSKAKLKELKMVASEGLAAGRFISTNDALCALLWQSVSVARGLHRNKSQATKMTITVDIRARTSLPLPEEYSGNADVATLSEASAKDLAEEPLSWSASIVRDAISRVDQAYVETAIDWIDAQPNKAALGMSINTHQGPDLFITSLSKFPVDAIDLGFGTMLSVGPGRFKIPLDGFVALVNYQSNGGGTFAYVSLSAKHMKKLLRNEALMKYAMCEVRVAAPDRQR